MQVFKAFLRILRNCNDLGDCVFDYRSWCDHEQQ